MTELDMYTRKPHPLALNRKRKGWTQWDLSKRSHVHLSTISNTERRITYPHVSTQRALLVALGIPVHMRREIFGWPLGPSSDVEAATRDARELFHEERRR